MPIDLLPDAYVLAPLAIVAGALLLPNALLPMQRPWARYLMVGFVWLFVLRYLYWRVTVTLYADDLALHELAWIWLCFAVELLALFDAGILYLAFLRTTDRRAQADRNEAALRAVAPDRLPRVDVFIATYNEPLEVLEKTIVGALSLDYPNVRVWVLDDGRRRWLHDYCQRKGAGYINRPDNKGAKAGNINHALQQTDADFVMVLDADFVPQRNFLARTMGFFDDPKVGIVQIPHAFYNHDPMQTNLSVRKVLPDDQRFFFEAIMPSRDGWDAAFCCGSNSITRRSAIRQAGDALPEGSITEDMLLSLVLLRNGHVTRYLCERLAFGLAPESVSAFFVQRQRWARGAIQILFLPAGPLGRGLGFVHRLLFLPTHWLTQSLMLIVSLLAPLLFLVTALPPLANVTVPTALFYLFPMVLASVGGICAFAPKQYFPLAAQVLGMFQSFKLLPTVLATFAKPHGHIFKVTPKGAQAGGPGFERGIFCSAGAILIGTMGGMLLNAFPETRVVEQGALIPLVVFWGAINCVLLMLVMMMCLQVPIRRGEERFAIEETALLGGPEGAQHVRIVDLSMSGVALAGSALPAADAPVWVWLHEVGQVRGRVARVRDGVAGIAFDLPESVERDLLIRKIFTSGLDTTTVTASVWSVTVGMLRQIVSLNARVPLRLGPAPAEPPDEKLVAATRVVPPTHAVRRLAELAGARTELAA